jgi:hypothetical protein
MVNKVFIWLVRRIVEGFDSIVNCIFGTFNHSIVLFSVSVGGYKEPSTQRITTWTVRGCPNKLV